MSATRPEEGSLGFLLRVTFVATLGGFLFGFDTAVISGTIGFLKEGFALDAVMEGWVVSSALVGCIIGAAGAGWLSDRFGRKKVLILAAALFLVSATYSALPRALNILIVARFAGGIGVGVASMLSPLYIAELSPSRLRGRMVALYQLAITVGILTAYFSNALLLKLSTTLSLAEGSLLQWLFVDEVWRGMFGTETIPAALFLVLMFRVPESPRWLTKQGLTAQAERVLARINGAEAAAQEITEIKETIAEESGSMRQLFTPKMRIALLIGILLPVFSQLSGINAIIYYGPSIFNEAGFGRGDAFGSQVVIGIVNVLFTLVAIWKVDTLGRRPLLLFGLSGVLLALVVIGVLFWAGTPAPGFLLGMLLFYIACFAFSYGPGVWIIVSEIFPTRIRGRAMSIGTLAIWSANSIVGQAFPWMLGNLGPAGSFWAFALITVPAVLFVWRYVPETKGRSLEEIEKQWME